jgi:hypothetical protein
MTDNVTADCRSERKLPWLRLVNESGQFVKGDGLALLDVLQRAPGRASNRTPVRRSPTSTLRERTPPVVAGTFSTVSRRGSMLLSGEGLRAFIWIAQVRRGRQARTG